MPYRYSTIDIIVGVGMCAIVFGALLFFVAANGTYQVALPQPLSFEHPAGIERGSIWLQLALGQAIIEQALFDRHNNQAIAQSASEWNRATLAYQEIQGRPGGPFGDVMRQATTIPLDHKARVQGVIGRAIVNFTARGVRSGRLSADLYRSDYNTNMIRSTEAGGQRLEHEFASTWQAILGRRIVEASQEDRRQASAIQERLGRALVQVAQAQTGSDTVRAAQQEQLASLVVAAIRTGALVDGATLSAADESLPRDTAMASIEPAAWPEIPMGYLIAASFMLAVVFFGGLSLAARGREKQALAEMRYDASRWVYRMAA